MRARIAALTVATLSIAGVLAMRTHRVMKKSERTQDADEVAELKSEIDALKVRMGTAETMSGAALGRTLSAGAREAPEPKRAVETAPQSLPAPPTPEQQIARFRAYFDQLDTLRGSGTDVAEVKRFNDALSKIEWRDGEAGKPSSESVACSNGYCRVSLTFDDVETAADARSRLTVGVMTISSGTTLFLDPARSRVEGYFATDGRALPPFPGTDG
jgi:hypothetical protein